MLREAEHEHDAMPPHATPCYTPSRLTPDHAQVLTPEGKPEVLNIRNEDEWLWGVHQNKPVSAKPTTVDLKDTSLGFCGF